MEPVKFEENIRQQLQKREIQPSAGSWEKLQGRLEHQKKQSPWSFRWIGIVAAIAVCFFLFGTFFSNPFAEKAPVVVENPSEEVLPESEEVNPKKIIKQPQEIVVAASEEVENSDSFEPSEKTKMASASEKEVEDVQKKPEAIIVTHAEPDRTEPETEVVAGGVELEVSDAEIETLLARANAEIAEDPAYAIQAITAEDLLSDVETELEQSFRQKVFEVLKEGFSKAKTAVANRNF